MSFGVTESNAVPCTLVLRFGPKIAATPYKIAPKPYKIGPLGAKTLN